MTNTPTPMDFSELEEWLKNTGKDTGSISIFLSSSFMTMVQVQSMAWAQLLDTVEVLMGVERSENE